MRPVEQILLSSLAEEDEPLWWGALFNSVGPWSATELFDALADLSEAGLVRASQAGFLETYAITEAGRAALDAGGAAGDVES